MSALIQRVRVRKAVILIASVIAAVLIGLVATIGVVKAVSPSVTVPARTILVVNTGPDVSFETDVAQGAGKTYIKAAGDYLALDLAEGSVSKAGWQLTHKTTDLTSPIQIYTLNRI